MKGFVPTPASVVDLMLGKLLQGRDPGAARILDPGCGEGQFIDGINRLCERAIHSTAELAGD